MSKNIAISDEVYRKLKREKGDRTFSEAIEAILDRDGRLSDVTDQEIFEPGTHEAVEAEIGRLSRATRYNPGDETG